MLRNNYRSRNLIGLTHEEKRYGLVPRERVGSGHETRPRARGEMGVVMQS